ncbi:BA75_01350T0 [Komagataella pastoris]|uniref:ATP synthase subunit 5, mitochondrial n=1 Tax=Komagataella pastoris TaxID=4922 RepID=A0A1B2J5Y5_PICPA|nr:BA75_01350T0 [Komagataella pastoris]
MFTRSFVRSMATAAKTVKPPVQLYGLDGTYATALYTASVKVSSVDQAAGSLNKLKTYLDTDSTTSGIVNNPALSLNDRTFVIKTLNSKLSLDKSVSNLLEVLAENNRLGLLSDIVKQFGVLTDAHNGVVEATVTSASALDKKSLNRIQQAITGSEFVGQGKSLKINNQVNPDILGGLIVEVADRTVDLSISAKIAKLNKVLTESL